MKSLLKPNFNFCLEDNLIVLKPLTKDDINQNYISWLNDPDINEYLEISKFKNNTENDVFNYINTRRKVVLMFLAFLRK